MTGRTRTRLNQLEQNVKPGSVYAVWIDNSEPGEPEPPAETVQLKVWIGKELSFMTLAEFQERFPEGTLVHLCFGEHDALDEPGEEPA